MNHHAVTRELAAKQSDSEQILDNYDPFPIYKSEELAIAGTHLEPLKRLFGNYIFEGSHIILGAERGSGKSFLATQICLKIAAEERRFLDEPIERFGNCLYLDYELGERLNQERLMHLYASMGKSPDKHEVYYTFPKGDLSEHLPWIERKIMEIKPVLMVIDNLKTAFRGSDLQKNSDTISVMSELNDMVKRNDCALLSIAHTRKHAGREATSSDLISGAGSIPDLADGDFFLRKTGQAQKRILKRSKSRLCAETDFAKIIRMNDDNRWFDVVENDVNELDYLPMSKDESDRERKIDEAKRMKAAGMSDYEIAQQLGVNRSTVGRWFKKDN